jgi:capsular polysaccharide biosynthesis protein
LKRLVSEELDLDSFPGTIEIAVVPETNLLTVGVKSSTPDVSFRLMNTLLECYPTVGKDVLGEIVIEIFEKPTFPSVPDTRVHNGKVMLYGFAAGMALIVVLFAFMSQA